METLWPIFFGTMSTLVCCHEVDLPCRSTVDNLNHTSIHESYVTFKAISEEEPSSLSTPHHKRTIVLVGRT